MKEKSILKTAAAVSILIFCSVSLLPPVSLSAEEKTETAKETSTEPVKERSVTNPGLIEKYDRPGNFDFDTGEHLLINMLVAAFTGGVFGAGSSLALYKDDDTSANKKNMTLFAAGLGGFGALVGATVTLFEYRRLQQFTIGKDLMEYTWYGGLGGAMLGALGGLIPYSSSEKTEDILKYTGYGTMAGLVASWALFFIIPPDSMKLTTWFDPQRGFILQATRTF